MPEQRKRQETRRRLVEAASKLYSERGFDAVTIDEIAALAGVARRTFFRYFDVKEESAFPFNEARIELMKRAFLNRAGGRPATIVDIRAVFSEMSQEFMAHAETAAENRKIIEKSAALVRFDLSINLDWERVIAHGIDGTLALQDQESVPPTSYAAELAAGAIIGALLPAFRAWYAGDVKGDLKILGLEALDLIENGMGHGPLAGSRYAPDKPGGA